jgi:hypothetical protein
MEGLEKQAEKGKSGLSHLSKGPSIGAYHRINLPWDFLFICLVSVSETGHLIDEA